jgi:hypothetical protein
LRDAGSAVILPHATLVITAAMKTSAMADDTALLFIMSMLLYILRSKTLHRTKRPGRRKGTAARVFKRTIRLYVYRQTKNK